MTVDDDERMREERSVVYAYQEDPVHHCNNCTRRYQISYSPVSMDSIAIRRAVESFIFVWDIRSRFRSIVGLVGYSILIMPLIASDIMAGN